MKTVASSSPARPASSASTCAACSSSRATSCAGSRARAPAVLEELGVEHVRGDVLVGRRARSRARRRRRRCSTSPARSRAIPTTRQRMMRLHVDGTRRVLERMAAAGVRRMVLASTVGHDRRLEARGDPRRDARRTPRRSSPAGRTTPRRSTRSGSRSSTASGSASRSSRSTRRCCSAPAIAGCRRPATSASSSSARSRRCPTAASTSSTRATRREATANALEQGRAGERYLLGGPNWTTKEFFARLGRVANVSPPRLKLPPKWNKLRRLARRGALPLARQGAAGRSHLASRWPSTTGGSTRSKAERELGFARARPAAHARRHRPLPAPGRRPMHDRSRESASRSLASARRSRSWSAASRRARSGRARRVERARSLPLLLPRAAGPEAVARLPRRRGSPAVWAPRSASNSRTRRGRTSAVASLGGRRTDDDVRVPTPWETFARWLGPPRGYQLTRMADPPAARGRLRVRVPRASCSRGRRCSGRTG